MRATLNRRTVFRNAPSPARRRQARARTVRLERKALNIARAAPRIADLEPEAFGPNPHVDYARALTPGGGVLIAFKTLDERFGPRFGQFLLWLLATAMEADWLMYHVAPGHAQTIWAAIGLAIVNWLIVVTKIQIQRTIEIRPDCMIIDGFKVFWRAKMESLPGFIPKRKYYVFFVSKDPHYVFEGIYGTRNVEYMTAHRLDDADRTPDVLASHLAQAMQQMWMQPKAQR